MAEDDLGSEDDDFDDDFPELEECDSSGHTDSSPEPQTIVVNSSDPSPHLYVISTHGQLSFSADQELHEEVPPIKLYDEELRDEEGDELDDDEDDDDDEEEELDDDDDEDEEEDEEEEDDDDELDDDEDDELEEDSDDIGHSSTVAARTYAPPTFKNVHPPSLPLIHITPDWGSDPLIGNSTISSPPQ